MSKHIVVVSPGYPTPNDPIYTFIRPVVCGMVDRGMKCTVISPQSITSGLLHGKKRRAIDWNDYSSNGNAIRVLQPYMLSFSNIKIGKIKLTQVMMQRALKKAFGKLECKPDIIYGHFWRSALAAASFSKQGEIPVFVVSGESEINKELIYDKISKNKRYIRGLISVSTKNLEESKELGLFEEDTPYIICPNAIEASDFYVMDKAEARKKLNYSINEKIAVFVGAFSDRKGVLRVVKAAENISDLKLILIGNGNQEPNNDNNNILFAGSVPHSEIVTYLNAADFFVLPTLAEGCCNAIVEAMACGLPIISSDLPFNKDILNEDNALLINPSDIDEISNAMKLLCNKEEMRHKMSQYSIEKSKELTMDGRITQILNFIEENCNMGGE